MISNPERCTDLFVVMFKLEDGWVGQNKSYRCLNLEIRTEKWTVPYKTDDGYSCNHAEWEAEHSE